MRIFICLVFLANMAHAHPTPQIDYAVVDGKATVTATEGITPNTPFAIASVGKTFTSVAILQAHAAGLVNVQDWAADWLDHDIVAGLGRMEGITIHHMLTMTSGLPDYYDDGFVEDLMREPQEYGDARTAVTYAFDQPTLFTPGAEFDYSNTNYLLLGLILEAAYDADYADVLRQNIFAPLGMKNTQVFGRGPLPDAFPKGHQDRTHIRSYYEHGGFGDGGAISSARDLERFYRALFEDRTVLRGSEMHLLLTPPLNSGYGAGVLLHKGLVGHDGGDIGFSSLALFNRKTGDFAVRLVGEDDADLERVWDVLGR